MSEAKPVSTGPHLRHTGILSNGSGAVSVPVGGRSNGSSMDRHAATQVSRDAVAAKGVQYDNNFHTRR